MQSRESRGRIFIPLFIFAACLSSIWIVHTSLHPHLPEPGEPACFYSNQSRQNLRVLVLEALSKAKQSIYLSVFGLSDPSILHALYKQIGANIDTKVYYDPTGASLRVPPPYRPFFTPLKQNGLMHQKILIIDQDLILMGSANLTPTSLSMHDNLMIGLRCPRAAQFLLEHPPFTPGYLRTVSGGQEIELWLLPDPRGHALADLRRRIRSASKSIRGALFTLTHPSILEELLAAKKRGVSISLVIDKHSALGASARAVDELRRGGVYISFSQGLQLLHHKFVIIDNQSLIAGSANWTKAAFAKNSDALLIFNQLNKKQSLYMNRLWYQIKTESKPN